MKTYDIAIVGAGPAGAVAAYAASKLGLDNILIEKKFKGRDKFCGGGISYGALEFLTRNVSKEIYETADIYSDGYVAVSPKGRILCASLKKYSGILVRRKIFDAKLMELAESMGSKFVEKTKIVQIRKDDDLIVLISAKGEEIRARYIVLATGVNDTLSLQVGLPKFRVNQLGHCWGTEDAFPVDEHSKIWNTKYGLQKPIFLIFGPIKSGYGWFFPKNGYINIGIGTTLEESKNHKVIFQELLSKAFELGILKNRYVFKVDRSYLIPFSDLPRDRFVSIGFRTVAVGDAAGFVHPVTGEGIYGAVVSGWIASYIIKDALDKDDPNKLLQYEKSCMESFGEDMFIYGKKLAKLLYLSPTVLEVGFRGLMEDEKAVDLLTRLLAHAEHNINKKMYNYMIRHIPALAVKALSAREKVLYL